MKPTQRAEKAAQEASQYHQGSGIHADACFAIAEHHEEMANQTQDAERKAHLLAAEAWADAAEAETAHLATTDGEWVEVDDWYETKSGKATKKAEEASANAGDPQKAEDWA